MQRTLLTVAAAAACLSLVHCAAVAQHTVATPRHPDLAVEEVVLNEVRGSHVDGDHVVVDYEVSVVVKNLGTGAAPRCTVMLGFSTDMTAGSPVDWQTTETTRLLNPDASTTVSFVVRTSLRTTGQNLSGFLIAVVDPPVAGHTSGQVGEHGALATLRGTKLDTNNVFGFIFALDAAKIQIPYHWDNPAVE